MKTVAIMLLLVWWPAAAHARDGGFAQVTGPCNLSFPADHGPHPDYRSEWWYYTGNLEDAEGRRFGFQLTFFRSRLAPPSGRAEWPDPASPWRTDQLYLAHAAISDISGERHLQAEKMRRPALSMAGAEQDDSRWKIHLDDWQAVIGPDRHRLNAATRDFAIALELAPLKPPVPHGVDGYSRKGGSAERASCYYSLTRLQAAGTLTLGGSAHQVHGLAWMDHEFSTAPLQPGIIGWDWFSLQLSDRTEIMIFLLRRPDGRLDPASSGTYVRPSGQKRHLGSADLRITPLAHWTSPHTGAKYPNRWRLSISPLDLDVVVTASLPDQEMRTPRTTDVVYWEGSVRLQGRRAGNSIEGSGYVELTGYAEHFEAPM